MFSKVLSKATRAASFSQVMKANFASKNPVKVAVTGAAGQIGYSLLFRIASGQMLGPDQPVIIQLIDLPMMKNALEGVAMEINDCAFPLVAGIECHDTLKGGFTGTNYALLVGAKPRGPGMERADLLKDNGKIFIETGRSINDNSSKDVKVIVVGNPANTNCLIASHYAPDIPKENFTAMTRLDHNRGLYQIAEKLGSSVDGLEKFCIWGNHSPTMVPDLTNMTDNGKAVAPQIPRDWQESYYNPKVQKRGAEIIEARKLSSAASAANAAIEHIRDWALGCKGWTSMAIPSNGEYGVPKGLIFSFPVTCAGGKYKIVEGLKIDEYYQKKIDITTKELVEERDAVKELLK